VRVEKLAIKGRFGNWCAVPVTPTQPFPARRGRWPEAGWGVASKWTIDGRGGGASRIRLDEAVTPCTMREANFGESLAVSPDPIRPPATFPGRPRKALDFRPSATSIVPMRN
jgi:hypothetical protein